MTIPLQNRLDLLLGMLYAPGRAGPCESISGITRFEKLVWLLLLEKRKDPSLFDFRFEADNYGPYSERLVDDLQKLRSLGLVEIRETDSEVIADETNTTDQKPSLFSLTETGRRLVERKLAPGSEDVLEEIQDLKRRFNRRPLEHLVAYVYRNAPPDMLKKSVIRDRYFNWKDA